MSKSIDELSKRVLDDVERQRQHPSASPTQDRARVFGIFVQECLQNLGLSRSDFAQALDMEPELADGILEGVLPASELNDDLLMDIAQVLSYEPNVLKIMLNATPVPLTSDSSAEASAQAKSRQSRAR